MCILDQAASSIGNDIFGYGSNPLYSQDFYNSQAFSARTSLQSRLNYLDSLSKIQDVNACSESIYPVNNNNSMNKKLEAAKKYLKDRS